MPDTLPLIRTQLITQALHTRLATLTDVAVFTGEVPAHPPVLSGDIEGRVGPYVVIWPFNAGEDAELDLADTSADILFRCQLDCVAGYVDDTQYLVDRVWACVYRWSPTVADVTLGRFRPPAGAQSTIRPSLEIQPPRFSAALPFEIPATA